MTNPSNAAREAAQAAACPNNAVRDQEQLSLALMAAYESEVILRQMLKHLAGEAELAWAKAFALRLAALNEVGIAALIGSPTEETEHIRMVMEGNK